MRAIFCGNFEYDARQSEVERLFRRYGKVDRVDMKSGFAFVYMEDERDAEDAIRALDRTDFGRKGRRLRVEWTKQERGAGGGGGGAGRRSGGDRGGGSRRSSLRPSKTLFVINFDPQLTRTRDLERHFEPYGKIASVRIRRNFAFVQYEEQEDATKALEATDSSKLMDRVISVEYAVRDDDDRKEGGDRDRHRSPDRRRRSPSPYRRERGSPDYGRGERGSPDYGRGSSPAPNRRGRASPRYAHGSSRSPVRRERSGSDVRRERSRSPYGGGRKLSPENGRARSQSPYEEGRLGHGNGRDRSVSPYEKETSRRGNGDAKPYSPENGHGSPKEDGALSPANGRDRSVSPAPED